MPAQESGGRCGGSFGRVTAKDVLAQLQELIDTRPVDSPTPLEWAVGAYFLGDMSGPSCLSLRSDD